MSEDEVRNAVAQTTFIKHETNVNVKFLKLIIEVSLAYI